MARYIDADKLLEILNEELLYESSMFSQEQEEYLRRGLRIAINDVKRFPAEDVVPKSEVDRLEYTLTGVMHSVDKWLDGEELKQDEVNRAITMREKTLRIIEDAKSEIERLEKDNERLTVNMNAFGLAAKRLKEEKDALAREIFEEIEKIHEECIHIDPSTNIGYLLQSKFEHKLAELKKKYTKGEHDEQI